VPLDAPLRCVTQTLVVVEVFQQRIGEDDLRGRKSKVDRGPRRIKLLVGVSGRRPLPYFPRLTSITC
jgi:hypothetical protein